MKRWMALLLAGLLALPQGLVYAEELADGVTEEILMDNEIEEVSELEEDLIDTEPITDIEVEEELCDELEEVSANASAPTITGFYNSSKGGDIRWTKVNGATGYVLYRNRKADGLVKVTTINDPNTLSYIDTGVKDNCWGRVYAYYVRPIIDGKEGTKSNEVTLQRLAPMKITNKASNAAGQVSLTWACTVKDNKALGYEIQYATSTADLYGQKGSFQKVSVNGRNNLSKTITGLTGGQKYYFRIRGYVNYTHSVTGKTTKTWSQYSDVVNVTAQSSGASTNVKVGDTLFFGTYEQDNNTANGKEKIEWIVLDKSGSSVLLVSKYGLDYQPYNTTQTDITWEKCTLRTWLNNTFLNTAFTTAEKGKIKTTNVVNEDNPKYGTEGGNNTNDKVFLLGISEAEKFFKNDDDEYGRKNGYSAGRACKPTKYAIAQGAWQYEWESGQEEEMKKYQGNSWWWLRSPGNDSTFVVNIDAGGGFHLRGIYLTYSGTIRPALWMNL